jgi:hypothetical protein
MQRQILNKAALYSTNLSLASSRKIYSWMVTKRKIMAGTMPSPSGLYKTLEDRLNLHLFLGSLISKFVQILAKHILGAKSVFEAVNTPVRPEVCDSRYSKTYSQHLDKAVVGHEYFRPQR